MSVINKMHQDLNTSETEQPVISSAQGGNKKIKILLVIITLSLAICAAFILSEILITGEQVIVNNLPSKVSTNDNKSLVLVDSSVQEKPTIKDEQQILPVDTLQSIKSEGAKSDLHNDNSNETLLSAAEKERTNSVAVQTRYPAQPIENEEVMKPIVNAEPSSQSAPIESNKVKPKSTSNTSAIPKNPAVNTIKSGELKIEAAQLSNDQLAAIYLKEAEKARAKGDNQLAAQKWQKALNVKPDLNQVRKSLASYYYTLGENDRAARVLKKGALISPEYSDFNLMLARLSLKQGEQQKAFLYLEQNPPKVQGHLDYYATHAALAQKFQQYQRAEQLYKAMLTQRPRSGRWLMSLAISQDKQAKTDEAISAYEKALQQTDLSSKAKDYIKKRLVYLGKE